MPEDFSNLTNSGLSAISPKDREPQTLILTGASGGIGRALALELARAGVNLVLNARQAEPLVEVAKECEALGVKVSYVRGDASETHIALEMVAEALRLGNFSGFIHAAGVLHPGPWLWELPPERFREILASHVTAAFALIRAAVPELLKKGKGLAVFFGSYAAVSNLPGIGAYNVAKAAEEHLARQLAAEAPQITSFVFRPGATATRMQEQARTARGGGAAALHRVFRGYQRRGELDSPDQAAKTLVRLLTDNPPPLSRQDRPLKACAGRLSLLWAASRGLQGKFDYAEKVFTITKNSGGS